MRPPRAAVAAVMALALVQGGLLAHTAWDKSDTADEPSYIVGGMFQWVWVRRTVRPDENRWPRTVGLALNVPIGVGAYRPLRRWLCPDGITPYPCPGSAGDHLEPLGLDRVGTIEE
jgi:hypothetical protein